MEHILTARQFNPQQLGELFTVADDMYEIAHDSEARRDLADRYRGQMIATLFYEPSTRTRLSFESAAQRLGMGVLSTENAGEYSSAIKGESLTDSIETVARYADLIVLRHKETGAADIAAGASRVPIINAGDGKGEHPTQALLDLYTIQREKGRLENLTVVIGGDLANGRTARSLAQMLSHYDGNELRFVSVPELQIGDDIKSHLHEKNVAYAQTDDMYEALDGADVVYWTRLQRERLGDPEFEAKVGLVRMAVEAVPGIKVPIEFNEQLAKIGIELDEIYKSMLMNAAKGLLRARKEAAGVRGIESSFTLGQAALQTMEEDAIILHPLPRVDEIHPSVDEDPRAKYFDQVENGMYVRMALIDQLLHRQSGRSHTDSSIT